MKRNFEDGVLERIIETLGTPLFEFTVNASTDTVAAGVISSDQERLVYEMDTFLTGKIEAQFGLETVKEELRTRLTSCEGGPGEPLALTWYIACGGSMVTPETVSSLELTLLSLSKDLYPSFLLPPDDPSPSIFRENIAVSSNTYHHPANKKFQDLVLKDRLLKKIFTEYSDTSGWTTSMVFRSTLQGGSLQLWALVEMILRAAWRDRLSDKPLTLEEFLMETLKKWRFIYGAFAGKKQSIRARVSFTGIRLPSGDSFDFGDVQLREATGGERSRAPESLKGTLNGTDAEGNQVFTNYEGDVVAELEYPYFIACVDEPPDGQPARFPEDMANSQLFEDAIERLRLSLSLAVTRVHRVQIAPSWRLLDDPLGYGSMSWSDTKSAVNLMPTQITEDELAQWKKWYGLLSTNSAAKIQLAVSRVVRAIGERRDPVDVLIDSVIAWENLFGSREGEPTLRVTASLALLLEANYDKRRKLRTKLGKIYTLRSNVVHGTAMPTGEDVALCQESLDITVRALQALFEERPDVLEEPDSTSRSLRLLLGGESDGINSEVVKLK